jgi:hypothetical protein
MHRPRQLLRVIARNAKRLFVAVVGATFVVAGLGMLVLPGPGFLVLLVGLVVLATEFVWAERLLDRARTRGAKALGTVSDSRAGRGLLLASGLGLVAAGILAIVLIDSPVLGASLVLAGLAGLATLVPAVQRWVARYAAQG